MIRSWHLIYALDLPLSAAADTLLLPYDLTMRPDDPLGKRWHLEPDGNKQISREIIDDYEDFIRKSKIEPEWIRVYADGSGRHAVEITVKTEWEYINRTLIYDAHDARTRTVKWKHPIIHM